LLSISTLDKSIAALPNIQSVRSVVDPTGLGLVSNLVRPQAQLSSAAKALEGATTVDINVLLSDGSLGTIKSSLAYVQGLAAAYPTRATSAMSATAADLNTLSAAILAARQQALVANELDAISAELAQITPGSAEQATELGTLKAYFDGLGAAIPSVASQPSYKSAESALDSLASSPTPAGFVQLEAAVKDLSTWGKAQTPPIYYAPAGSTETAQLQALRTKLQSELVVDAAAFGANDLYAPTDLRSAYVSGDGTVARLYVTTVTSPYDTKSFDTVRQLRALLASPQDGAAFTAYVGGSTAEFADVQDTISADFLRVAAITIIGILLVLILLLRAFVAPLYLVVTVLLSYATSLSVSALILQHVFGQAGINYFIPLIVFVLLVALGSDYNIFLMSRVREESSTRDLRSGIRVASARTGTVITSAGLILAGTFGALVTSPLQLLFQAGLAVALGVLVDTFIVRSILVPAITAFIGEWAWWPFHRRSVK
jgi:RND superfamily putative drug exporter